VTESDKRILRLAVNLKGLQAKKFLEVQKYLGIESGTDVMRFLITWFHKREIPKKVNSEGE